MERPFRFLALFALLMSTPVWAEGLMAVAPKGVGLAFARYLNLVEQKATLKEPPTTQVEIEASLPKLAKHGRLRAIRRQALRGPVYEVLQIEGDTTIKQQVIARYLSTEAQAGAVPPSTVAISPANYKFRYAGSIAPSGRLVYIFQIAPKKKRTGLIEGQLWIDATTGLAVRQAGHLVKRPSVFVRRVDITRDTEIRDDGLVLRVTHVDIDTRLVGHARLRIEERPWGLEEDDRAADLTVNPAALLRNHDAGQSGSGQREVRRVSLGQ